jgi:hypothetical protein
VALDPNEIVWWIYHSNIGNPIFLPPVKGLKANGAAGDLGCYAAYVNQVIEHEKGIVMIPGSPDIKVYPWDSEIVPFTVKDDYNIAVNKMGEGTVSLVNAWLSTTPCATVKVTIVDASGFAGAMGPPKIKSYIFSKPITYFSPMTGGK